MLGEVDRQYISLLPLRTATAESRLNKCLNHLMLLYSHKEKTTNIDILKIAILISALLSPPPQFHPISATYEMSWILYW